MRNKNLPFHSTSSMCFCKKFPGEGAGTRSLYQSSDWGCSLDCQHFREMKPSGLQVGKLGFCLSPQIYPSSKQLGNGFPKLPKLESSTPKRRDEWPIWTLLTNVFQMRWHNMCLLSKNPYNTVITTWSLAKSWRSPRSIGSLKWTVLDFLWAVNWALEGVFIGAWFYFSRGTNGRLLLGLVDLLPPGLTLRHFPPHFSDLREVWSPWDPVIETATFSVPTKKKLRKNAWNGVVRNDVLPVCHEKVWSLTMRQVGGKFMGIPKRFGLPPMPHFPQEIASLITGLLRENDG